MCLLLNMGNDCISILKVRPKTELQEGGLTSRCCYSAVDGKATLRKNLPPVDPVTLMAALLGPVD